MDGRGKKLAKKANRGEIVLLREYLECVQLGVVPSVRPSVALALHHSRSECQHDLNAYEVRNLLLYMLRQTYDAPKPVHFVMHNQPFIRNVVIVHVARARDPIAFLKSLPFSLHQQQLAICRTGTGLNAATPLLRGLLSIPSEEAQGQGQAKRAADGERDKAKGGGKGGGKGEGAVGAPDDGCKVDVAPFLLPHGQRELWGYPQEQ
jgi:hypothetical protein